MAPKRRSTARETDCVTRREFEVLRTTVEQNRRDHEVTFRRIAHMQTEIDALKKTKP